jgi:hypothetical protein
MLLNAAPFAGELVGVAGMVAAHLALQQLKKQQAVDPGEAELEGHAKEAFGVGGTVGGALDQRDVGEQASGSEAVMGVAQQGIGLLALGGGPRALMSLRLLSFTSSSSEDRVVGGGAWVGKVKPCPPGYPRIPPTVRRGYCSTWPCVPPLLMALASAPLGMPLV